MTFAQKSALSEMLNAIIAVSHGPQEIKSRAGFLLWRLQGNHLSFVS